MIPLNLRCLIEANLKMRGEIDGLPIVQEKAFTFFSLQEHHYKTSWSQVTFLIQISKVPPSFTPFPLPQKNRA